MDIEDNMMLLLCVDNSVGGVGVGTLDVSAQKKSRQSEQAERRAQRGGRSSTHECSHSARIIQNYQNTPSHQQHATQVYKTRP